MQAGSIGILVALTCINSGQPSDARDVPPPSNFDHFVIDVIALYKLTSPTVIIGDDSDEIPEYCISSWVLCISNAKEDNLIIVAQYLIAIHKENKQDGIIFTDQQKNNELVELLSREVPSVFTSNCPVLMPIDYDDLVKLRLDSNIIYYQKGTNPDSYKLVDKFAVKERPLITLHIGTWDTSNGIILEKSLNRWDRRTDLKGVEIISGLWITLDSTYQIWFQDQLSCITNKLNLTTQSVVIGGRWIKMKNGS